MPQAKNQPAEPGFRFIALIAFLTAIMAMSIDTMLPSMGVMAKELGASNPNDEQLIILTFFLGNMAGIPVFGPVSDSLGRKQTIFAGLAIYAIGALLCYLSTSFGLLLFGRLIQGFGGASPRIVALAMVRDGAKGAAMARIMSFVMSVFMLVPVFAPTLGKIIVLYADWRFIFLCLLAASIIAGAWLELGQEETLAPENRRPFSARQIWSGAVEVCSNRISLGYTLATGMVFGVFTTYLSLCRRIYVDQYGLETAFPYIFGSLAICLAIAMVFNGNLVQRLGMHRLARRAMQAYIGVWAAVLLASLAFGGHPPILLLLALFAVWFFSAGFTFGNFSAMAMEPMGHIAGMAAAISGALSQGMGIVLAYFTGLFYNGSITTIAWFFVFYAMAAFAAMLWAAGGRPVAARTASPDLPAAH